jgi:hypothetical protein
MAKITFIKGGLSNLTMERGRSIPLSMPIEINQELYQTESMNAKVIDYGSKATYIKMEFRFLSKDNYDGAVNGLSTWFNSSQINWCSNSFTMVDESGVSHTVRLWQTNWDMPRDINNNRYSVVFILKKEA